MKKLFKAVLALTLVVVMAISAVACSGNQKPASSSASSAPASGSAAAGAVKLGISHTSSLESPWNKASMKFADVVNKDANSKMSVEVFGNGVLNQKNWQVMFEQTQSGSNAIAIESLTSFSSLVPELGAVAMPFLFGSAEQLQKFLDSNPAVLQKWYKKFEDKNLVVLAVAPRPFRQNINNKHVIKTPDDIKGLKFRVPTSPVFVKIFEAMGAKPVPLPSGEIYSSIQLGTVVGEDNSIPVVYDFKTHEVAKNMTIWNYIADLSIMVINKDIYNKLTDDQKTILKNAGKEWAKTDVAEDVAYTKVAKEAMTKAGVTFYEMPDADKAPFKALEQPIYDEFKKTLGDADYKAFMDAVQAAAK